MHAYNFMKCDYEFLNELKWCFIVLSGVSWRLEPNVKERPRRSKEPRDMHVCFLMGPCKFGLVAYVCFGWNLFWMSKGFKGCIYIWNVRVRLIKGPTKGPTRRTKGWLRHCLGSVNRRNKWWPVGWPTDRSWGLVYWNLAGQVSTQKIGKDQSTEAKGRPINWIMASQLGPSMVAWCLCMCPVSLKGWIGTSPLVLNWPHMIYVIKCTPRNHHCWWSSRTTWSLYSQGWITKF